jgi:hypothetical protein
MTSPSMQPQKGQPAKAGHKGKRKPHLLGNPDNAITPLVAWSGAVVTVSSIPQEENGDATGVNVDGTALNFNAASNNWSATVAQRATGNTITVTYSATLSYSNTSFPSSTTTPRCPKN